jgi:hypothetical protein
MDEVNLKTTDGKNTAHMVISQKLAVAADTKSCRMGIKII